MEGSGVTYVMSIIHRSIWVTAQGHKKKKEEKEKENGGGHPVKGALGWAFISFLSERLQASHVSLRSNVLAQRQRYKHSYA